MTKHKSVLNSLKIKEGLAELENSNKAFHKKYQGTIKTRQPVHTVYGGAHLFKSDTSVKLGLIAKRIMEQYAPDPWSLARAIQLPGWEKLPNKKEDGDKLFKSSSHTEESAWLAQTIYSRVMNKIEQEPVEDFRIDFEDGFGVRSDQEEDATAVQAAHQTALGMENKTLPPFIGIRIKDFDSAPLRALRTLDIYIRELLDKTGGKLPDNFIITQPKVFIPAHTSMLADALEEMENSYSLKSGALRVEIMIELTQSIFNSQGKSAIWELVAGARERCRGIHFGTYDYTASCGIIAHQQTMDNPVCDFAKHIMQTACMGSKIMISDGATNVMPVPIFREPKNNVELQANTDSVYNAWQVHVANINHSLRSGFYQGWDLHPGQLPIRYAACYSFYLSGFNQMVERIKNFIEMSAKATLVGNVFDDAATGQGLVNYFLKSYNCGAINKADLTKIGLRLQDLESHNFSAIIKNYKK